MLKNNPAKIFLLVLAVILLLLPWQWVPALSFGGYDVKRVALLSDVLPDSAAVSEAVLPPPPPLPVASASASTSASSVVQDSCPKGVVCIEDYADGEKRGMESFYEALSQVNTLSRPVRIAYLGDSFIEVDILTSSLRSLLQGKFGGAGVGWLDVAPPYAANRSTVRQRYGGWDARCVLEKGRYSRNQLNLNQRYFIPQGSAWTEIKGVAKTRLDTTEVHTMYLRSHVPVTAGVKLGGGPMLAMHAQGNGRVEALCHRGRAGTVRWQVRGGAGITCWGVAEESRRGVIVDNFSLRGSSGTTLGEIPVENLRGLNEVRPYDLIVLQFGLNVAEKTQTNYTNYIAQMKRVVEHMKQSFPQAGILIIGVGDRENRLSDGQLHTLPGVLALMRYQQRMAADCRVAYWNLYKGMGGEGSIRRMAEAKPAEAGKDYTHINLRGGDRVARSLFKSIVYGFQQYKKYKAN